MDDNSMVGNLKDILITPIKSEQIREESGKTLFWPHACLDAYLTMELSLLPKWDLQFEMINDN